VITVCADGRVFHTQVSESILPFTPEPVATLPVGELAILAGATAVAVAIIAGREEPSNQPLRIGRTSCYAERTRRSVPLVLTSSLKSRFAQLALEESSVTASAAVSIPRQSRGL